MRWQRSWRGASQRCGRQEDAGGFEETAHNLCKRKRSVCVCVRVRAAVWGSYGPQIAVREWKSVSSCRTFRKVQTAAHGNHQERHCLKRWVCCIISLHAPIPLNFVVQAPALADTLYPLQLDTSTMTTPSQAAPLTPSAVAWAAPVRTKPETFSSGSLCFFLAHPVFFSIYFFFQMCLKAFPYFPPQWCPWIPVQDRGTILMAMSPALVGWKLRPIPSRAEQDAHAKVFTGGFILELFVRK